MVSQKRLDYGFNGYQLPPTPRAARSARRNGSFRKRTEGNQMCAFDLLATVAGNLLLEGDTSPSSSNILNGKEQCGIAKDSLKRDQEDRDKNLKVEPCDQGRCDRGSIVSKFVSQAPEYISKELPNAQNDTCFELASVTSSDIFETVVSQEKLVNDKSKIEVGTFGDKLELSSNGYKVSCDCVVEDDKKKQIKTELPKTGKLAVTTRADMTSSVDQVVWDRKPPALVSVNNVVKVPLCRDHISGGLVIRDDDENTSGCTQPSTVTKAFRPPTRIGDHRVRNLLASKYWKVTPKLKDEEHSCSDAEIKPVCHNQINSYKRQRSQRDYPFKKRKLYYRSSVSNSDGGVSSEGLSSSHEKGFSKDTSGLDSTVHGVTGTSTSVASQHAFFQSTDSDGVRDFGAAVLGATETSDSVSGQNTSFHSRDSHVKLRIKSLKVPELFIEIPETATVGSLKRTVMEAVTAILGCGLRVGVLLQGKKVRDDNKTLQQTGISHDKKLDALGFTLEPNPMQALPPPCHDDHSFLLPCGASQPLTRYPSSPNDAHNVVKQGTPDASLDHPAANLGNIIESDHDSAPSSPDIVDKRTTASRALVAVPAMNVEALAVVPMQKSKRSEVVQRRVRRPFSVSEVEALVQAVEKLGTGRWREVKLRAFDNAKHRTYVDLKDKWKTLVHTARISPQQRRGEPVPQELLDRVLSAHAYWSQQQQLKQQSETCRLL